MPTQNIHVVTEVGSVESAYNELAKLQKTLKYLLNGNLDFENIRARSIKAENIEAGTITANEIKANTITAEQIAAGTITVANIDITELLTAIAAEIEVIVSNTTITNILSAQTGYIAELTVDRLETSDKVQRYLASDTTDVNYIRAQDQYIEWVTAKTTGTSTEQPKDREGNPLYWLDADKIGVTITPTAWPVLQYVYTELTKAAFGFKLVGDDYTPEIQLGVGTGSGDNGKSFIRKLEDGLMLDYYHSTSGSLRRLKITDGGIEQEGGIGSKGMRNIAISNTAPTSPQINDLWIDTSA